ncbi:hypothetical protein SCAR479_04743 [Seiridium cardinale]|uniref:Uncharacterized protein n=1 Tax=Seiridium cardinale TaxID=138064 RepID=A0ABR2XX54_9PEZI
MGVTDVKVTLTRHQLCTEFLPPTIAAVSSRFSGGAGVAPKVSNQRLLLQAYRYDAQAHVASIKRIDKYKLLPTIARVHVLILKMSFFRREALSPGDLHYFWLCCFDDLRRCDARNLAPERQ